MTDLPVNIDSTYPDRSAGDALHQQHHDELHDLYNKLAGATPDGSAVPALANATSPLVPKATLDANTLLKADADDTPTALAVPASRLVGRKATGGIGALTTAEVAGLFGTPDGTKFLADDGTLKAPAERLVGTARLRKNGVQVASSGSVTVISLDTVSFISGLSNATADRITVPAGYGGRYLISVGILFAGGNSGARNVQARLNGTSYPLDVGVSGLGGRLAGAVVTQLAAGDYVQLSVYVDGGASVNAGGSGVNDSWLVLERLGDTV